VVTRRPGLIAAVALLAGCCALAACTGTPSPAIIPPDRAGEATVPLGPNLVEEPCRGQPQIDAAASPDVARAYQVLCGTWEEPSARVFEIDSIGESRALARQLAAEGWWREYLEGRMTCGAPDDTAILDGMPALVLDCTLRNGGWPYLAVVAATGSRIYLADGIPAALPPMETAIGVLAGRVDPGAERTASRSAAVERLEAQLGGRLYGTGDLQVYAQLLRVAQYHNGLKNFAEAEQRYRDALEVHRRLLPEDDVGRSDALVNLALELSNQERFAEAGALFDRAGDILIDAPDPTDYPRLISYRALHEANQRNYESALELAREATALRRSLAGRSAAGDVQTGRLGREQSVDIGLTILEAGAGTGLQTVVQAEIAHSLYIEAAMLWRLGRLDEAASALAAADAVYERAPAAPDWWRPLFDVLAADIALSGGDHGAAESLLLGAIAGQRALFNESRLEGLAQASLGRAYAETGRPDAAFVAYRAAFPIIEANGRGLAFETVQPFFELAMQAAAGDPGRAQALYAEMFEVAQLVRSTVTSQTIAVVAARLSASDREVGRLIRELQDARRRRDELTDEINRIEGDPNLPPDRLPALQEELTATSVAIREFEAQVQAASPAYNQLVDAPVDTERMQALLQPDEALVQVLLGEPRSYLFVIRRDRLAVRRLDLTLPLARALVRVLREPVDRAGEGLRAFDVQAAHSLYRAIFGAAEAELADAQHLIVVPNGPLLSLPFGVLVEEEPRAVSGGDYSRVAWLGARTAITLAPSASAFANLRGLARPTDAPSAFLGFGDFQPLGDAEALLADRGLPPACLDDVRRVAEAPRLPETAGEVQRVAASFRGRGADIHIGASFGEATLRDLPLDRYAILYFATHGLLPGQLNCWSEPSLLVSRPETGEEGDGLLLASEIIELDLNADLVVLSACNTGGGEGGSGGESLTGLARAFFYAGARSLLVSHWIVPSEATVELMTGTFAELGGGRAGRAEALRRGQAAILARPETSHPFFWGAFTLVGDGG
jgi:CHAT domain-containing protein